MRYRVEIWPSVRQKIASWNLPDAVLVEVYLRLRETLPENPTRHLRRTEHPFEGIVYEFSLVDPDNRLCEHFFTFLILYSQDEQALILANGGYLRCVGM